MSEESSADRRLGRREGGIVVGFITYSSMLWLLWRLVDAEQYDAAVSLASSMFLPSLALITGLWSLKVFDPMSKRGSDASQDPY
ncbi:MAG: hypothetical protein AAFO72_05220 [Pseudomonadota bacterium]